MNRKFRLYNGQGLQVIIEEHEDDEICGAGTLCLEDAVDILNKQQKEIIKLEKQLEEKEKEIKILKENHKEAMTNALNDFIELRFSINDKATTFAIEQLEKLREKLGTRLSDFKLKWGEKIMVGKFCNITNETIDNQIKELKEQL